MRASFNRTVHLVGLGLLSWLVPFLISISFVSPDGQPIIDIFAFKSVMLLVFEAIGAALFAYYIPRLNGNYFRRAAVAGITWFGVNVFLDLLILVTIFGTPFNEWITRTGPRYFTLVIWGIAIGYTVKKAS